MRAHVRRVRAVGRSHAAQPPARTTPTALAVSASTGTTATTATIAVSRTATGAVSVSRAAAEPVATATAAAEPVATVTVLRGRQGHCVVREKDHDSKVQKVEVEESLRAHVRPLLTTRRRRRSFLHAHAACQLAGFFSYLS